MFCQFCKYCSHVQDQVTEVTITMVETRGWIFSQKSYELGGILVWGICNFAVNLKPSFLLTPSQIQIFWLKIHPQFKQHDCANYQSLTIPTIPSYSMPHSCHSWMQTWLNGFCLPRLLCRWPPLQPHWLLNSFQAWLGW